MPSCAGPASTMPPKNGAGYWRRPRCASTCRSTSCSGTLAEGGTLHLVENLFSLPDYPAPRRDPACSIPCSSVLRRAARPRRPAGQGAHAEPGRRTAARPPGATDSWPTQVRRLVNLYRPTEDTTYSTVHELDLHAEALDEPPIGRPPPGTTVEVLDGFEAPLPLGVAGNCTSAASAWRVAISASRSRPPSVSASIRAAASAAIAPATAYACARTACWNTSAGSTTRSSSTASASSWARSPRAWRVFPG